MSDALESSQIELQRDDPPDDMQVDHEPELAKLCEE